MMFSSRSWLLAVLLFAMAGPATFASGTATVTVESKAAPIKFAGDEIRGALQKAGWTVGEVGADASLKVVLAEPDGQGEDECFEIATTKAGEAVSVRVRGKDVRGVMYGGLDVAEQIALGREPQSVEARQGKPYLPVRALKFNIPLAGNAYLSEEDQANSGWFYDLEYWRAFMRFLAYHRYNMLTFWNSHPYDQMVRLAKYPEASGLKTEELDQSIAFFHKLFGMARDYGLDTSLVTWNIHCSKAFQKAHNVRDGQDSPLIRDYQKECIRALLVEYPELTGIGTCPGENMGGTAEWRENWIRDTYFAGIAESGRKNVPFIHRYWGTSPGPAAKMLAESKYPGTVLLDIKFNGEHMYSSTTAHPEERGWLTQKPKPYRLFWHLRNDCIFQLRWGDPDFAAAVIRNCGGPESAGFVMGSEIEVPGVDRVHTPQTVGHKTWKYEFEKNWTRFGLWGRMGYNPAEPHEYWISRFAQRFGPQAAPAAFAALQSASKIIPLNSSFHWNYMNGDWYPEGCIGSWNTSDGVPFENYRDDKIFHSVLEWIFTHPIDTTYQAIPYYVADQLSGVETPADVSTSLKVADALDAAAAACEQQRLAAAGKVSVGKEEWECTEMDLKALEALGHYYAAKTRAATELMFFLATGEESRRAAAIGHLEKGLAYWKELAAIADGHYITHEVWLCGKFDWNRYTPEVERDIQLVREIAPWKREEQSWEIGPAKTAVKTQLWNTDYKAYPGLEKWVEAFNARAVGRLPKEAAAQADGRKGTTVLKFSREATAILAVRSSGVTSARVNGTECRLAGAVLDQFIITPVRAGENRLELTLAGRGTMLPVVTRQALLDKDASFVEGESGQITAPMAIKEMPGASSGKVIWSPNGKGRGDGPGGKAIDNGWVTYKVDVPTDGEYLIHAFVWWHDTAANTFFYAWDKAAPKVLGNDDLYERWHWIRSEPVKLTAGSHVLTIRNREEGAVLDCFIVAPAESASVDAARIGPMLDGYYERLSGPQHLSFKSLDDWKARREVVRKAVLRDLGLDPMPERLPLNTTYGGNLDRGDYTVRRIYFQTWPDVYASGWLYMPKSAGKHPAILNPNGHWDNGTRHPVEQSRSIGLVKKGYVALAVDSVHLPEDSFLVGASSIGAMTYNNIRALDLLESLDEVDKTRIGCTGGSGGGQQTMYLMAVDDRLAAAVPAVMVSYFRHIMNPQGFPHCICNILPDFLHDTDEPEMVAVFAPKPVRFLCVTGDWTRQFPKEEGPEIKSIYGLYGAESVVDWTQWESGHDYSKPMRERMYAFFNHHLLNNDDAQFATEPELKPESLETLNGLDKTPAGAKGVDTIVAWYKAKYAAAPVAPNDAAGWKSYQADVQKRLAGILGDMPVKGKPVGKGKAVKAAGLDAVDMVVDSEKGIQVPALLIPSGKAGRSPVAALIHPQGRKAVIEQYADLLQALHDGGAAVLVPEVRLTGELARAWTRDAILWGRPEAGMALTDLRACLDVVAADEKKVDAGHAVLVGLGDSGVTTLVAGVLEPRFAAVVVEQIGATYCEGRQAPVIANLLRVGDIPQLVAAMAPRGVVLGAAEAEQFGFAADAYRGLNADSKLTKRPAKLAASEMAKQALRELGCQ